MSSSKLIQKKTAEEKAAEKPQPAPGGRSAAKKGILH